ncbi:hypothetical protein HK104_004232, partial [Borealophlyctis nickersoniae]
MAVTRAAKRKSFGGVTRLKAFSAGNDERPLQTALKPVTLGKRQRAARKEKKLRPSGTFVSDKWLEQNRKPKRLQAIVSEVQALLENLDKLEPWQRCCASD